MFYIFESAIIGHRNGYIQAKVQHPTEWYSVAAKWDIERPLKPLEIPLPSFQFEVRTDVSHPDNYWTGANLDLYSGRFITLLQELGGFQFETFGAKLRARKSKQPLDLDYHVFRLLETFDYIDRANSVLLYEAKYIEKAAYFPAENAPHLFRDNAFYLVFVSETLKSLVEQANITGCSFITIEDYYARLKPIYNV